MSKEQAVYTHGHHESVVRDHARRTAQDSAAFLLPYIKPNHNLLDVGCGPGTITADFAELVPQGKVTGVDAVEAVLEQAKSFAESRGLKNIAFQSVDANALPFPDNSFDVVFCHQVLQHVKDPVGILKEMHRVAKPGGVVAAREADYRGFAWYPELPGIQKWADLYQKVAKVNGGEPNAGRYCHVWAKQAGFSPEQIEASWHSWRYAGERAKQFGDSWVNRTLKSSYAETSKKNGLATDEELQEISKTWGEWAAADDVFIALPSGEIVCHVK